MEQLQRGLQIACYPLEILFGAVPAGFAVMSAAAIPVPHVGKHPEVTCFSPQTCAATVATLVLATVASDLGDVSPHRLTPTSPGRMGMLFLVWGAQKVLKALPQGRKAMARCRWSWQRAPWLQLRLRCVPPPPPPPSVREAITAALSDPCWARWVHTLHRNIVPYQQVRWYHLVLCVTLVAMLIVHALERLDRRSARRDSLAHTAHRHRELLTAYLRQLARDEQAHNLILPLPLPLNPNPNPQPKASPPPNA